MDLTERAVKQLRAVAKELATDHGGTADGKPQEIDDYISMLERETYEALADAAEDFEPQTFQDFRRGSVF
jgi:hypothetical protein